MSRFIARIIINGVALWVASQLVPALYFPETANAPVVNILIVALIFGLVNAIIKPILALATCPFYVVTLGLFTFIVNALMLMLTGWLAGSIFVVDGFWGAFWGSIVISIVSTVLSIFVQDDDKKRRKKQ